MCTFMPLFETVYRNKFTYFYRNDFLIFFDFKGDAFRTMKQCVHRRYPAITIFSEVSLLCFLCENISYNLTRIAIFYLNHVYIKHHYIHCNWIFFFLIYTYKLSYTLRPKSSQGKISIQEVVLKNFAIFTVKHLCWSLFLMTFLWKWLQHRCFLVNVCIDAILRHVNALFCKTFISFTMNYNNLELLMSMDRICYLN